MRNIKVLVRGGYGFSNFGDDIMMAILHEELKDVYCEEDIFYLCKKAPYITNYINLQNVIDFNDYNNSIRIDTLIYGGGTQFYSFHKSTRFLALKVYDGLRTFSKFWKSMRYRLKSNNHLDTKYSLIHNADRIFLFAIGLGPFIKGSPEEDKTYEILKNSNYTFVRDELSENSIVHWGFKNYSLIPDMFFSNKLLDQLDVSTESRNDKCRNVGIIIRDWENDLKGKKYYKPLLKTIDDLKKKNYNVSIISFNVQSDNFWIAKSKELSIDLILWKPNEFHFIDFINQLKAFDFFITARFHGGIIASILERPFITIEVEPKLSELSNTFGLNNLCWLYPFKPNELLKKIDYLNLNYAHLSAKLKSKKQDFNSHYIAKVQLFKKQLKD